MTRAIVVTGASRGLGRALAIEYAAPGVALALIGRDAARLDSVAEAARAKGARVRIGRIDVRAEFSVPVAREAPARPLRSAARSLDDYLKERIEGKR